MKGAYLFVIFFFIFASAMLLIPLPMFPGNVVLALANAPSSGYTTYLSALINGIVYGLVTWAIFMVATKRIEDVASKNSRKNLNNKKSRAS